MIHPGKIARLPREIREELNHRLAAAESGGSLLRWLNDLPVMRAILAREFGGRPVSKQNLCKWRASGFAHWETRRELLEQQRAMLANVPKPPAATDGKWTDHLATLLAVRYASALARWNGQADVSFRTNLRTLRTLCHDIVQLRRGDHNVVRFKLEQDRRECEHEKTSGTRILRVRSEPDRPEFEHEQTGEPQADHFKLGTLCPLSSPGSVRRHRHPANPSGPVNPGQPKSTQVNPEEFFTQCGLAHPWAESSNSGTATPPASELRPPTSSGPSPVPSTKP